MHSRLPLALLLLAIILALPGCNIIGFMFNIPVQRVNAVYPIENRPTVILVEDNDRGFETHRNARQIATDIAFHLEQAEAVTQTVDQFTLRDLASAHGDDFRSMPLDSIANELNAEQLIHIYVRRVDLAPTTGTGLYRPTADIEVQLIDAVAGQRLFPTSRPSEGPNRRQTGHRMEIELDYHNAGNPSRDVEHMLARDLARQTAQDVAALFFRHSESHFD